MSASQRDQVYLNLAKEEVKMKQNMVNFLAEATRESNKAFYQFGKSIEKVDESILNGLALLTQAFGKFPQGSMTMTSNYYQTQPGLFNWPKAYSFIT